MYQFITNARNLFSEKKIQHISILFLYVIAAFFLLVNGKGITEYWDQNWTISIMIYMIGVNAFININEKLPVELKRPVSDSIIGFCITFILITTFFIMMHMAGLMFNDVEPVNPAIALPFVLFQLIVCPSEEIIFRGALLPLLYKVNWFIGYMGSAGAFALFHYAAYGGSITLMIMAFVMGIILNYTTIRFNIGVSIAIHFSYNLCVLGILLIWLYA